MKNIDLGQVFTRRIVSDYMVSLFTLPSGSSVLDPCFGGGVFLDSIKENTDYIPFGYEIDKNLFEEYKTKSGLENLLNEDFLLGEKGRKFDGVIMNPPYIRHEKINELVLFGISKDVLGKEATYQILPKTSNLYMYFILKAIESLKPSGELVVIFPKSWMNTKNSNLFLRLLERKCSIVSQIHIVGNIFQQSALVDVLVLKLVKSKELNDCNPIFLEVGDNSITQISIPASDSDHSTSLSSVPLTQYANTRRGITTGYNKVFINPKIDYFANSRVIFDIISSPKMVNGYSTRNAKLDKILLLDKDFDIEGDLFDYINKVKSTIIDQKSPKTLAKKIDNNEPWYYLKNISCKGIIFSYIVRKDLKFILNEKGTMVRDNFYVIEPKIDEHLLLSLLNNYYTYIQLEVVGKRYGGGMLKLQKYDIDSIKLPNILEINDTDLNALIGYGKILSEKGSEETICNISKIISKYESKNCEATKKDLYTMQTNRLECK